MERFPYENVPLPHDQLPILIFEKHRDSGEPGCAFHWHEELEFYYVASGGVLLGCGGEQDWLCPGDVGFVNSCIPHRGMAFLDHTKHYIIQVNLEFFQGETEYATRRSYASLLLERLRDAPVFLRGDKELAGVFEKLIEEWNHKEPGMELAVKACLFQIAVRLLRAAPLSNPALPSEQSGTDSLRRVQEALLYLASHYDHPEEVTLTCVASKLGLSVPYLCRVFRRYTGRTVIGYTNELRCARAAALIRGGVPLTEAGRQVGIEDYNYFSRMFKKTTGHSPSSFREGK